MILLIAFLGILFISLPFIPAILEASKPSDATPLKVSNQTLKDPRSNPEDLFWHLTHLLGVSSLEDLKNKLRVVDALPEIPSLLVTHEKRIKTLPPQIDRVIASEDLSLDNDQAYLSKILSMASIESGKQNALNEVHAQKNLTLQENSKVMWWASGKNVFIKNGVILTGKLSGREKVTYSGKVVFHQIHAPIIESEVSFADLPPPFIPFSLVRERKVIIGDFELKENEVLEADLIVRGKFKLGKNAQIRGHLKCHQKTTFEAGSIVCGNVVVTDDLTLDRNHWIGGTVLCEKTLTIGPNTVLGSDQHLTTCSAKTIFIEGAFRCHGLLRAWKYGEFKAFQNEKLA